MKVFNESGLVKAWVDHVPLDKNTVDQVNRMASLPFIHKHIALMPDAHLGKGSTVGSVIPTKGAIIPAAVGVDIGCGMMAQKLSIRAEDLPDSLSGLRSDIEKGTPVGNGAGGNFSRSDIHRNYGIYRKLNTKLEVILAKNPKIANLSKLSPCSQLGTLGGGNHFIEVCLDEEGFVWVMLHSGSRGIGNKIGSYFITKAKEEMERYFVTLPDKDLSYLSEGSIYFNDYVEAVGWAQDYASWNRKAMMAQVMKAIYSNFGKVEVLQEAINCHHNYVEKENHFNDNVWVTRKGAVRAREGDLGIIPGSMGAKSFIVRGLGNKDSFCSCSHGAGRVMSRSEAKRRVSLEDHIKSTEGIECRKDSGIIDETPSAYKNIDDVMKSQEDLVEVVSTLKQVVCVKG